MKKRNERKRVGSEKHGSTLWMLPVLALALAAPAHSGEAQVPERPTAEPSIERLGAPASYPALDDTAALETFIDGVMKAHFAHLNIPAAVISIVRGDEVLFAKGYGEASYEQRLPVDPASSLFRIGSTSKLFTWTAVMQLAERGEVDLDADVNTYLTSVQIPATFPEPITLRHLLTHTPGLEDGFLGYLITEDTVDIRPIAEVMARHRPARVRPAGEFSSYSNYGTALAGLIVEEVSGVPFDDYIERHIFEPLGMLQASFREPLPAALAPHMTTGYAREAGIFVPKPFEVVGGFRPAGSASVSALDMARFMIAHLHEGAYGEAAILRPETARLMHATAFQHDPRLPGMALGFYEQRINGLRLIGHGGDTFRFHTNMLLVPEERLGLFVSYVGDGGVPARDGLVRAFFDRYFPSPDPVTPPIAGEVADLAADNGGSAGSGEAYAGKYRFMRMSHTKIDKILNLVMPPLSVTALEGDRLLLSGMGQDPAQFALIGEHLFREVGGHTELAFRVSDGGTATHAFVDFLPFMATERVPWYDLPSLWYTLLGVSLLLFLGVLVGYGYRRKEVGQMLPEEKRAIRIQVATAGWFVLTLVVTGIVVASYGEALFSSIPWGLRAVLVMPILFVLLAGLLAWTTLRAWRGGYWGFFKRIRFTAVALAAISMCLFFYQWNLLGWQFG